MKKQLSLLVIMLQFISLTSFSQLKIVNSGNVGIGTTSPIGKLHVNGRIFITGNNNTFRILPDNPGTEIGSSTGRIDFWYTSINWTKLYAKSYYTMSDSVLKRDITPIDSSLAIIRLLNGVKYHFNPSLDSATNQLVGDTNSYEFGFIAQEVEQVIPSLVSESKGYKAINYQGIIPFLVEAIKNQQLIIDSINTRLSTLEQFVDQCCSANRISGSINSTKLSVELSSISSIILNQNDPNPFADNTTITWFLPENSKNAILYFYDNNGRILKTLQINETGKGELLVYCSNLKSGIYTYSLVVNGKIIDSKKMVCNK